MSVNVNSTITVMLSRHQLETKPSHEQYDKIRGNVVLTALSIRDLILTHCLQGTSYVGAVLSGHEPEGHGWTQRYICTTLLTLDFDHPGASLQEMLQLGSGLLPLYAYYSMSSTKDHPRFHLAFPVVPDAGFPRLGYNKLMRDINQTYYQGLADKQALSCLKHITGTTTGCAWLNWDPNYHPINARELYGY
jgi:hypothetical protein